MKTLQLVFLFFIGFLSTSAQNIPNASFENWHAYSFGEYPDFWKRVTVSHLLMEEGQVFLNHRPIRMMELLVYI